MKKTVVVCGFPGVGKSFIVNSSHVDAVDSDSSSYSWTEPGVRNPEFPDNYIKHIEESIGQHDFIFVSSHQVVRDALDEKGIHHFVVVPKVEDKDSYIKRYRQRGNEASFVSMMEENFESFVESIEDTRNGKVVTLETGYFLADILDYFNQSE